jgi:hypothetical protein
MTKTPKAPIGKGLFWEWKCSAPPVLGGLVKSVSQAPRGHCLIQSAI